MNAKQFIDRLGNTYQQLIDVGLLKETNHFDDDDAIDHIDICLDDFGIILQFDKESLVLKCVSVDIIEKTESLNILPFPLKVNMSKSDVEKALGVPVVSKPPRVILKRQTGGVDQFYWGSDDTYSMLVYYFYDSQTIKNITVRPSVDVSWGRQG